MATSSVGVVDVYNVLEVDTTKPWQMLSHYFPDKVGGKPAWLSLKPLPSPEALKCGRCEKPCVFLLQKYAPTETLHRMIFIFVCRDPACCRQDATDNFVVLRSQLPLKNEFYRETPPDEEYFDMSSDYPKPGRFTRLCVACGCAGPKLCGKCHRMAYCSKEHQTSHWKVRHRSACGRTSEGLCSRSLTIYTSSYCTQLFVLIVYEVFHATNILLMTAINADKIYAVFNSCLTTANHHKPRKITLVVLIAK